MQFLLEIPIDGGILLFVVESSLSDNPVMDSSS